MVVKVILSGIILMLASSCASGKASAFDAYIRPHTDRITLCYISVLREEPHAAGEIEINVTVGEDGKVIAADLVKNTFSDDRVGRCVAAIIREISFPASNQHKVVSFTYPIQFLSETPTNERRKK